MFGSKEGLWPVKSGCYKSPMAVSAEGVDLASWVQNDAVEVASGGLVNGG